MSEDAAPAPWPWVYVAGPITKGTPSGVLRDAIDAAQELYGHDCLPYIPHLDIITDLVYPRSWDEWLAIDLKIVERCDAVFRLPGESPGARKEVTHAGRMGIPVFRTWPALAAWRQTWKT